VQSSLVTKLTDSLAINQVQASDYQAIYFAGGSGPMFDFINNEGMHKLTAQIYESGVFFPLIVTALPAYSM